MAKMPTAKEVLSDPKFGEQKGFFKELFSGLLEEMQAENEEKKIKKPKESTNIFDAIFGGNDE